MAENSAYIQQRAIGKGAYGTAYIVQHKTDGKRYVLKKVRLARQSHQERQASINELLILSNLRHRNVLDFHEAWVEGGCVVCMVVALCESGDLATQMRLRVPEQQAFAEVHLQEMLVQLASALAYLHKNNIAHRDVKSGNIFITGEGCLKLADFGLATVLEGGNHTSSVMVGTPGYMAPELMREEAYGVMNDIWGLGCVMYELTALKPAFQAFDMQGLLRKVTSANPAPLPASYSEDYRAVIRAMLSKEVDKRPTAADILAMPWLQAAKQRVEARFGPALAPGCSSTVVMQPLPEPIRKLDDQFKQQEKDQERREKESRERRAALQEKYLPRAIKEREAKEAAAKAGRKDGAASRDSSPGAAAAGAAAEPAGGSSKNTSPAARAAAPAPTPAAAAGAGAAAAAPAAAGRPPLAAPGRARAAAAAAAQRIGAVAAAPAAAGSRRPPALCVPGAAVQGKPKRASDSGEAGDGAQAAAARRERPGSAPPDSPVRKPSLARPPTDPSAPPTSSRDAAADQQRQQAAAPAQAPKPAAPRRTSSISSAAGGGGSSSSSARPAAPAATAAAAASAASGAAKAAASKAPGASGPPAASAASAGASGGASTAAAAGIRALNLNASARAQQQQPATSSPRGAAATATRRTSSSHHAPAEALTSSRPAPKVPHCSSFSIPQSALAKDAPQPAPPVPA